MLGKVKQKMNTYGVLKNNNWKKDWKPNMFLDDGGDLTALMHNEHRIY